MLNFSKKIWSFKTIIFVLLGVKIKFNFQIFFEKIAFVSLSFLSLSVTTDLMGSFLGFLREEKLVIYESLEAIVKTNLKVFTFGYFNWMANNDTVLQALKKKSRKISFNLQDIIAFLEPNVFIGPRSTAKILNNALKKLFPMHPHSLLPSNITVSSTGRSITLEKNSPFVDTFNMVALRTKEFGLDQRAEHLYHDRCFHVGDNWFKFDWETSQKSEDVSSSFIFLFYSIGVILSGVVFVGELGKNGNIPCGLSWKKKGKKISPVIQRNRRCREFLKMKEIKLNNFGIFRSICAGCLRFAIFLFGSFAKIRCSIGTKWFRKLIKKNNGT